MKISWIKCRKQLALTWFVGAGLLFAVLLLQSIFGKYGNQVSAAWAWFLPSIMPTLSLIIGVLISDALSDEDNELKIVDRFIFRLSPTLSIVYLVVLSSTFFLQPFTNYTMVELMELSNLWLAPIQGFVSGTLGIFFIKRTAK